VHHAEWQANVNPRKCKTLQELDQEGSTNLSLAEQRLNKIARLRSFMRYMNKERFDFLITKLADLDMGLKGA